MLKNKKRRLKEKCLNCKEVEETLIQISLKLAKEGKGCLFVIEEKSIKYEILINQDITPFNIVDDKNRRRLELLASHDGACIINPNGNLIAYGVNISNVKVFNGFGTRHSAAYTASLFGNTAIIASEEDKKVRIFKKGRLIMQIDSLERGIERKSSEISNILESLGVGALGVIGTSSLGFVGIALMPGVIVFGGAYYLLKKLIYK